MSARAAEGLIASWQAFRSTAAWVELGRSLTVYSRAKTAVCILLLQFQMVQGYLKACECARWPEFAFLMADHVIVNLKHNFLAVSVCK